MGFGPDPTRDRGTALKRPRHEDCQDPSDINHKDDQP